MTDSKNVMIRYMDSFSVSHFVGTIESSVMIPAVVAYSRFNTIAIEIAPQLPTAIFAA